MKYISVNLQLSYEDILHLCYESLKNVNPNPHICEGEIHSLTGFPSTNHMKPDFYICWNSTRYPSNTCYKVLALWRILTGIHYILPDALNLYVHAHHTCLQKMRRYWICTHIPFLIWGTSGCAIQFVSLDLCIFLKMLEFCISGTVQYLCTLQPLTRG